MNDSQKHSKIEMEILAHEKEMMRAARIKKLKDASLEERISFIISDSGKTDWTAAEMKEKLAGEGLDDNSETAEIEKILNLKKEQ